MRNEPNNPNFYTKEERLSLTSSQEEGLRKLHSNQKSLTLDLNWYSSYFVSKTCAKGTIY